MAAIGCAGPGNSSESMELVLNAPGLENVQPVTREIKEDSNQIISLYIWNAGGTQWPQVTLYFLRIKDLIRQRITYVRKATLPELVESHFPGEPTTLGASGSAENVLGQLRFQRFRREAAGDCIFIEQGVSRFSDSVDVRGPWPPLGDMVVRGWYCAQSIEPSPSPAFRGFITGIGIRGWALPYGVSEDTPTTAAPAFAPGTFDGEWEGMMTCESCANCPGPLAKPITITIDDSRFELVTDLSYQGAGVVDGSGRMSVRWLPAQYDWGTQSRKTFWFQGDFDGEKFELSGIRGPRSCRITLHQING